MAQQGTETAKDQLGLTDVRGAYIEINNETVIQPTDRAGSDFAANKVLDPSGGAAQVHPANFFQDRSVF